MTRLRRAHTAPFGARTVVPTAGKSSKAPAAAVRGAGSKGPKSAIGKEGAKGAKERTILDGLAMEEVMNNDADALAPRHVERQEAG